MLVLKLAVLSCLIESQVVIGCCVNRKRGKAKSRAQCVSHVSEFPQISPHRQQFGKKERRKNRDGDTAEAMNEHELQSERKGIQSLLILSGIAWSKSRPHSRCVISCLPGENTMFVCICVHMLTGALMCMCGQSPIPSSAAVSIRWWPHSYYRRTHIFDPLTGLNWKSAYRDPLVSVTSWTSEAQRPGTDFH